MATLHYSVFHSVKVLLQKVMSHFLTSSFGLGSEGCDYGKTVGWQGMVVPTCCCMLKKALELVRRSFSVGTGR